jgi:amino acid permease
MCPEGPQVEPMKWTSVSPWREAALLITGTAVGGGSLALPYFTAAGGFLPAVALICTSYAVLLASAMLLMVGPDG